MKYKIGANANFGVIRKGAWTGEEDKLLRNCIQKHGEGNWHRVPQRAGLNRCRKSCRLRWYNYLKPNIKRGQFLDDEVDLIIRLHKLLGNKWSLIAGRIPGRTANDVKNYWNTHLCKKLSPLSFPIKHSNTPSSPKSENIIVHPHIIKPQPSILSKILPSVIDKPDPLSSLCRSNGLNNGPTMISVEMYEKRENEEGIGREQLNGLRDGLGYKKPISFVQVPRSAVDHIQEVNVWEEDNLWNFEVNMWE